MNPAAELSDCPSSDTTHQSWKTSESFAQAAHNLSVYEVPWFKTRLRIPRGDETIFARPDLPATPDLARSNRDFLNGATVEIQGRPLTELRQSARRDVLELARNYTADLLGESVEVHSAPELLFCSGHQPALFHPGVWIKNFVIHALAEYAGGTALNLVIDNDTVGSRQLRVPAGDREHPQAGRIAFDDPLPALPWEEAVIENSAKFEKFGQEAVAAMERWNIQPLLSSIWPDAVSQSRRSSSLRDAFTAARTKQERRWGLSNLELPLSRVCETDAFLWFAAAILTRLPKFWETYNTVLAEFRQVNHVRSQTHPVPALAEEDGCYEAPFWVWSAGDTKRLRVTAKACSREVRLSDGREVFARLPISAAGDVLAAVDVLKELPKRGIRFRTRALTTTLFARLCLSDLFVHGIGGAKYDEMTDRLIARFFGLPAPGFLTMSCTAHLPLGEPFHATPEEEQWLRHELRDLDYNPERHLPKGVDPHWDALMAEKQSLIAEQHAVQSRTGLSHAERRSRSRENHRRYGRLQAITAELAAYTAEPRRLLEAELATVRQHRGANAILEDREFSFSLYPEEKLRPFLTGIGQRLANNR